MNDEELKDKVAYLESLNDQLMTEISHIDELMRLLGFANGLETVKETANDIFRKNDFDEEYDDEME